MAAADEVAALQFTPTWIVAAVCSVLVLISLAAERGLHHLGKTLKKNNQSLYEALLKVKEELMLLGFISLLLTVFQVTIQRTCIPPSWTEYMLPCQRPGASHQPPGVAATGPRFTVAEILGGISRARVLSEGEAGAGAGLCQKEGKVPLLSEEALHQLHIFIFVLAVAHVFFSATTMLLGGAKIHKWKQWEEEIQKNHAAGIGPKKVLPVQQLSFIRERYKGFGKDSMALCWLHSFIKQFYGSVAKSDYNTMRLGFIMTHCRGNPNFDFHRYMMRALESDFKKIVSTSWSLWVSVVIFLLLNVNGWHAYFWMAFLPLVLLLAVGTKLEHVIAQLAYDVAARHTAIEGDLVVNPSDEHFWFGQPRIVLHLIHFILFQNAFQLSFFFWILMTYGFESCFMDHVGFMVPRLVLGVVIQLLCSYSTLPLYAIVTQVHGELLQEGDLQRARAAGRHRLGGEGQEEIGAEGGPLHRRVHARRRRCGLGLEW
ncbi:unnamed protein product [Urochloa decumbens]|uniref:MLO-like protein n=1 Tax=Urochloa decumbens TaxID=240449 RepID=A0ABC8VM84_9POAL